MKLTILTPYRKLAEGLEVEELFVPGHAGLLDILEGHANLVSSLETGVMRWRQGATWTRATVTTGTLEIYEGQVTILADVSEFENEIDVNRAKTAEVKSRKKLEEGGLDDENFKKYQLKLERSLARQSVHQLN